MQFYREPSLNRRDNANSLHKSAQNGSQTDRQNAPRVTKRVFRAFSVLSWLFKKGFLEDLPKCKDLGFLYFSQLQ